MFSLKFVARIGSARKRREVIQALQELIQPGKEYTFRYLVDRFPAIPPQVLALLLSELVSSGVLRNVVRIESPETGGGIGDYDSLLDVPDQIFDFRTQREIVVTPDNVVTLFTKMPEAA